MSKQFQVVSQPSELMLIEPGSKLNKLIVRWIFVLCGGRGCWWVCRRRRASPHNPPISSGQDQSGGYEADGVLAGARVPQDHHLLERPGRLVCNSKYIYHELESPVLT